MTIAPKKGKTMPIRQTHTYVELGLSQAAYDEIKQKLADAGYQHAFMDDGAIDMHGIGVTLEHNPLTDAAAAAHARRPFCDDVGSGP